MKPTGSSVVFALVIAVGLAAGVILSGCATSSSRALPPGAAEPYNVGMIQESDVLEVTFPGLTEVTSKVLVPVEGTIRLPFAGEFKAVGRTPRELEQDILDKYGDQLAVREVNVVIASPAAAVYVSGAVLRPGKIPLVRPLTLLDAVMECGGLQQERARGKETRLIREIDGVQRIFVINLQKALERDTNPIYLRPGDVVHVPVRIFNL